MKLLDYFARSSTIWSICPQVFRVSVGDILSRLSPQVVMSLFKSFAQSGNNSQHLLGYWLSSVVSNRLEDFNQENAYAFLLLLEQLKGTITKENMEQEINADVSKLTNQFTHCLFTTVLSNYNSDV